MRYIFLLTLFFVSLSASAQIYRPPQTYGIRENRIKADSTLHLPLDTSNKTRSNILDPGAIVYNLSDSAIYAWDGKRWIKQGRTGPNVALDSAYRSHDTIYFPTTTGGLISVKMTGIPQGNITGLTDTLLNKVPLSRAITLTSGAGINVAGGTQSMLSDRSWTISNSGVLTVAGRSGSVVIDTGDIANFSLKVRSRFSAGTGVGINTSGVISNSGVLTVAGRSGSVIIDTSDISNFYIKVRSVTGGAGYIQNQFNSAQTANGWISGTYRTEGDFRVTKNGSSSINISFLLRNALNEANRGANIQLTEGAIPGLAFWLHDGFNWLERMRINAGGNVLLGTTTDDGASKLQVAGNISAAGVLSSTANYISTPINTTSLRFQNPSGALRASFSATMNEAGSNTGYDILLNRYDDNQVSQGPWIYLQRSTGFVGLNGVTPSAALHARGFSSSTGDAFRVDNSAGTTLFSISNINAVNLKGAAIFNITIQSSNYTVQTTDYSLVATAAITYTLPASIPGRILIFKNRSAGNVTISPSSCTIEGNATSITLSPGASITLQSYTSTDYNRISVL